MSRPSVQAIWCVPVVPLCPGLRPPPFQCTRMTLAAPPEIVGKRCRKTARMVSVGDGGIDSLGRSPDNAAPTGAEARLRANDDRLFQTEARNVAGTA